VILEKITENYSQSKKCNSYFPYLKRTRVNMVFGEYLTEKFKVFLFYIILLNRIDEMLRYHSINRESDFFVFDIKAVSEAESLPPNELRNFVF